MNILTTAAVFLLVSTRTVVTGQKQDNVDSSTSSLPMTNNVTTEGVNNNNIMLPPFVKDPFDEVDETTTTNTNNNGSSNNNNNNNNNNTVRDGYYFLRRGDGKYNQNLKDNIKSGMTLKKNALIGNGNDTIDIFNNKQQQQRGCLNDGQLALSRTFGVSIEPSIYDKICTNDMYSEFCHAIHEADLVKELSTGDYSWTIFVPTNEAFLGLSLPTDDKEQLRDMVLFHTHNNGVLYKNDLPCEAGNNIIPMSNGKQSRTLCEDGIPYWQKGYGNQDDTDLPQFIDFDIETCNGIIHTLDKVLLAKPL